MTKKATLATWADALGAAVPADATVPQLEQAIETAIAKPADEPQYSLRDGIAANLAVLRSELPGTVRAVVANLRGQSHAA